MRRLGWTGLAIWLPVAVFSLGCGNAADTPSTGEQEPAQAGESTTPDDDLYADLVIYEGDTSTPQLALHAFLTAVQKGEHSSTEQLLSAKARVEIARSGRTIKPPGSPDAKFRIGDVERKSDENGEGAHVVCHWEERDQNGEPFVDEIVWLLRREKAGWRVAGMVFKVLDGKPAMVMNFEDPEDMFRKQKLAEQALNEQEARIAREPADGRSPAQASKTTLQR